MTDFGNTLSASGFDKLTIEVPPHIVQYIVSVVGDDKSKMTEFAVDTILECGYRGTSAIGSAVNTTTLEAVFENQSSGLLSELNGYKDQFTDLLDTKVTNSDSELSESLSGIVASIQELIDAMADTTVDESLASVIGDIASTRVDAVMSQIVEALDTGMTTSLAAKLVSTVSGALVPINQLIASIEQSRQADKEWMTQALGLKSDLEKSESTHPGKGTEFEDEVLESLILAASAYGDIARDISTNDDSIGTSKKGDQLIDVKLEGKTIGKIVFESKAGKWKLTGKEDSLPSQLSEAMTDNASAYSVGVVDLAFSLKKLVDVGMLAPRPNMYIVGVDRSEGDFSHLTFLYSIVRSQIISDYINDTGGSTEVDMAMVEEIIKAAKSDLEIIASLRKNLKTTSETSLNVRQRLQNLEQSLQERMDSLLRAFLAKSKSEDEGDAT